MSNFLIPSKRAAVELQLTHERTFFVEVENRECPILFLKLTPTHVLSIINGAPIEIIIGSPILQPNTLSFKLNDIFESPFWITKEVDDFGPTDKSPLPFLPVNAGIIFSSRLSITSIGHVLDSLVDDYFRLGCEIGLLLFCNKVDNAAQQTCATDRLTQAFVRLCTATRHTAASSALYTQPAADA